ncbi:hypothetical protein AVEN_202715-1 [Araneus ventricosus]|uniref:Transposon Ty3-I Gag-Pol polyprotein n=1 Tax=Araneus ventricosus TaxID=182803 RepID=A0A4Y2W0B0_ARAVE|nr:hypothetical protein AVEN_202715-1 [Araneus ventricosus]
MVRLSEMVKEQQEKLIEKDSASVNAISPNKPAKFLKQKLSSGARKQSVKPDIHRKNNENESTCLENLKPGAIPFAITSPRGVPIPLLKQIKAELERMVEEKVITPVLKPTEWCAPVVILPKSDGNVRICVDLVELNKNVMRELHPLPKAEYSLNLLAGGKHFSKLDANSGF